MSPAIPAHCDWHRCSARKTPRPATPALSPASTRRGKSRPARREVMLSSRAVRGDAQGLVAHVRASVQRQSNVAAEEPCLVCLIQSYLKNVVFALRRCSFAPCLKALQIHASDNLVGRFSLASALPPPVAGEEAVFVQATSLQRSRAGGVSGVSSVCFSVVSLSFSHKIGSFFAVTTVSGRSHHMGVLSYLFFHIVGYVCDAFRHQRIVCCVR